MLQPLFGQQVDETVQTNGLGVTFDGVAMAGITRDAHLLTRRE